MSRTVCVATITGMFIALACVGCSSSWKHTGNPGCCGEDTVTVPRENFEAVRAGMTRQEVVAYLGTPTDESLNVMHWEMGAFRDAWVVFDDAGEKAASKYWQDDETLRLADVPQVR